MKNVDLIITNGIIYTADSSFSMVESLAVQDGHIIALGTTAEIISRYKSDSVIDLQGKPVYPGFNDAHCHFFGYGMGLVRYSNLKETVGVEDVISRLKTHYEKYKSEWLLGRGWDQNDWPGKTFPGKDELDRAFPDVPVYLVRIDGHAAWVNSKALELAGIIGKTTISGGQVMIANGEPTGVLVDNAMDKVSSLIPQPNHEEIVKALQMASTNCFSLGLTSVTDAGLDKNVIDIIDSLQKSGILKMRIDAMISPNQENFDAYLKKGIISTDYLRVGSIKLYADGALGSRGAYLLEPYSDDPSNRGLEVSNLEYLKKIAHLAYENNFQLCTHAIGDAANRNVLDAYGSVLNEKNDKRWRIEHAQVIEESDFEKFARFSIIPSVQPTHATSDMYWADERLGQRLKNAYSYHRLMTQNGWLPLGTDFPIEEVNPILTFYAAVVRKDTKGWPEGGFQMENALSKEDALRGMTIWAAKSSFQEQIKGSLEVGKLADFVILDEDIMTISPEKIPGTTVLFTFINGQKVYSVQK